MTTLEERRLVRAMSIACHRQRKRNPRFDTWELDTWGPAYRRAVMKHLALLCFTLTWSHFYENK